jgi:hypothetical protein
MNQSAGHTAVGVIASHNAIFSAVVTMAVSFTVAACQPTMAPRIAVHDKGHIDETRPRSGIGSRAKKIEVAFTISLASLRSRASRSGP